jgi:hypothetical protein
MSTSRAMFILKATSGLNSINQNQPQNRYTTIKTEVPPKDYLKIADTQARALFCLGN